MSVKIDRANQTFTLFTKNTQYVFRLYRDRFPVHCYYGKRTRTVPGFKPEHRSFAPFYEECGPTYFPELAPSEFSWYGRGDFRTNSLKLRDLTDGSAIFDFEYRSAKRRSGRVAIEGLPFADADEKTETLELLLCDRRTGCKLYLYYTVFAECDVISRYFRLENGGKDTLKIEKCMSLLLDLPDCRYDLISFWGGHNKERKFTRSPILRGNQRIFSRRGVSSHHYNPCILLTAPKATEERGEAYGFNFVYSGSFLDEVEVDQMGHTRVAVGLGDEDFEYTLAPGESFTSPEAVMTFSGKGIGQVSRNLHRFTNRHILPRRKDPRRPILINSWEGFYFDINADLILDFAKDAKHCGFDLMVMDDGWFGKRLNDFTSLGDWTPNPERFPQGLETLVKKVHDEGIGFGLWLEPEMISSDSDLYRAHPDWALAGPGIKPLVSRNQLVLNMGNPAVVEYLKQTLGDLLDRTKVDYVKWDMNRNLCDVYSNVLPAERQGEAHFRFMLGTYELLRWLTERYPDMLLETCSGGGGRYDLGMMKYGSQIWTSDNSLPVARTYIQYGSSFGYPASTMSCHVAEHKGTLEDPKRENFSAQVAMGGVFGYELNVLKYDEPIKQQIHARIDEYRGYENIVNTGDLYRLLSPETDGVYSFCYADDAADEILFFFLQPEDDPKEREKTVRVTPARKDAVYRDTISGQDYTGEELRRGLHIRCQKTGEFSQMLHLIRKA